MEIFPSLYHSSQWSQPLFVPDHLFKIQDVFVHPGPIPIMQYFFRNSVVLVRGVTIEYS